MKRTDVHPMPVPIEGGVFTRLSAPVPLEAMGVNLIREDLTPGRDARRRFPSPWVLPTPLEFRVGLRCYLSVGIRAPVWYSERWTAIAAPHKSEISH